MQRFYALFQYSAVVWAHFLRKMYSYKLLPPEAFTLMLSVQSLCACCYPNLSYPKRLTACKAVYSAPALSQQIGNKMLCCMQPRLREGMCVPCPAYSLFFGQFFLNFNSFLNGLRRGLISTLTTLKWSTAVLLRCSLPLVPQVRS